MRGRYPSIPTRIFLGFAMLGVAFVGLGVLSLLQHDATSRSLRRLHEGYLPLALTIGEAKANEAVFVALLGNLLEESSTSLERDWLGIARRVRPATIRRALHGAHRVERLAESPEERRDAQQIIASLERVQQRFETANSSIDRVLTSLRRGDPTAAGRELAFARTLEVDAQRRLRELHLELEERSATVAREASEQEARAAAFFGAITLAGLLLGLLVTWMSYRLLAPLPLLQARVGAVARGEFSNPLAPVGDDELGRLTIEFERMVEALAARDLHLREAAESMRRLTAMQEQIVAGLRSAVLVVDGNDRLRVANPVAMRLLGLGEEAIGRDVESSGLSASIPGVADVIAEVRADAKVAHRTALEAPRGKRLDLRASPFGELEASAKGAVLLVVDDVTDELATKARLLSSERLAAIGRMAAHVTHEVRNPLSSIALNVEMLADELDAGSSEARELIAAVHREIDRLTAITEEYLRLARVPEPRLEPSDLGELIEGLVRFVRAEAERHGVRVVAEIPADLPLVAYDESQLRQALLNLLRNAREAMPDGGEVRVTLGHDDGFVELRVADEGIGLAEELRTRIFDPFFSTKTQGTGLGLPLTQQIVSAHGGTIRCEPNGARGTVFVLRLPVVAASDKQSAA